MTPQKIVNRNKEAEEAHNRIEEIRALVLREDDSRLNQMLEMTNKMNRKIENIRKYAKHKESCEFQNCNCGLDELL